MSDTFGRYFTFESKGGSHDPVLRGIVNGLPAGIEIDFALVKNDLSRRNPGNYPGSTKRIEADEVIWLSGIDGNHTNGKAIVFEIENTNTRSGDYDNLKGVFRPSHADYTYFKKFGSIESAGKGRASGRETVLRVVAGSLARQYLLRENIEILAYVIEIGGIKVSFKPDEIIEEGIRSSVINCPDKDAEKNILEEIKKAEQDGDTLGGVIECIIKGLPAGVGAPVFHKLHAELAAAAMSIPSAKGFELGEGFHAARMKGSLYNDQFIVDRFNNIATLTNHDGGIQGGISNGNPIVFRLGFKPVSSIAKSQTTVDADKKIRKINISGRHDVCIVPRACVIVESMAAMTITDHILGHN